MAARTYAEHKADADASLPSPPVVWAVLDTPEPGYNHEHVATASLFFNEVGYEYTGTVEVGNDVEQWGVEIKADGSVVTGQVSWEVTRRAFAVYWEHVCEAERVRLASNNYGKDVVENDPRGVQGQADQLGHIAGQPGAHAGVGPGHLRIHGHQHRLFPSNGPTGRSALRGALADSGFYCFHYGRYNADSRRP